MILEAILTPTELPAVARRDLRTTACVVFDILRATSTFVTALQNGAAAIIPVSEITEAVALRRSRPDILLAGERDGLKIRSAQSGGVDFDFGNSPREFTPDAVRGKTIVSTTTNGTRALRACAGAQCVLAASFLNLAATAKFIGQKDFTNVLLVCAGTGENPASEDINAAGALISLLSNSQHAPLEISANAHVAKTTFDVAARSFPSALHDSQNGRRLLANAELHDDVAFCARQNIFELVAVMHADGTLRRVTV